MALTFLKPLKQYLIALDIKETGNHKYDVFYSWNDLDKIDWSKIDAIIHLAGKAHDTKNTSHEKAYFKINVGLTQKIFEYFLKSNASKFLFFSSVKAVADTVKGEYLTEEAGLSPGTAYGKSKLEAEKYTKGRLNEWVTSRPDCHPERSEGSHEKGHYFQSGGSSSSLLRMTSPPLVRGVL